MPASSAVSARKSCHGNISSLQAWLAPPVAWEYEYQPPRVLKVEKAWVPGTRSVLQTWQSYSHCVIQGSCATDFLWWHQWARWPKPSPEATGPRGAMQHYSCVSVQLMWQRHWILQSHSNSHVWPVVTVSDMQFLKMGGWGNVWRRVSSNWSLWFWSLCLFESARLDWGGPPLLKINGLLDCQ